MRILQCIWRMRIGGTEGQVVRLASGLRRRGIDLHVVTALPGTYDSALDGAVHRIRPYFKYDGFTLLRFIALCRRLRPDVVHTFLTQMDILGGMAASLLRIPWVLSERSAAGAYPPIPRHRIRAALGRHADAIIANSPGGADYWHTVAPRARRISVIPNIVPQSAIDAAGGICDATLNEMILYVGRFSAEKNLFVLLEALAPILERRNATAVFAGDGLLRHDVERKARELGMANRARFLGNIGDVWSWMKRASVVVAVSTFEGNPNAVLEAAAAGTPLVLSDIPGHHALFNRDAAWYVDGTSPEAIHCGIEQALDERTEAAARAARARAAIGSRSEDEISAQYEAVYRELVAERRT
jgi:glycosyltransferase involved in cell wall biosynthesis